MMQTTAIVGHHGGSGRTSCSYLLALSAGLAGYKAVLIQTDLRTGALPMSAPSRPYWLFGLDAGQPEQSVNTMKAVFDRAERSVGRQLLEEFTGILGIPPEFKG